MNKNNSFNRLVLAGSALVLASASAFATDPTMADVVTQAGDWKTAGIGIGIGILLYVLGRRLISKLAK